MWVISIKQPFAELVCLGVIDVVNLPFKKKLFGKLFIHASSNDEDYNPTKEQFAEIEKIESFNFHNNAIIGSVDIIEIVENHESIWATGKYHLLFKNPMLFENPIENIKGRPLLWKYKHQI